MGLAIMGYVMIQFLMLSARLLYVGICHIFGESSSVLQHSVYGGPFLENNQLKSLFTTLAMVHKVQGPILLTNFTDVGTLF